MFIYALLVNFAVHLNYIIILCYYYVILIVIFLHLINFGRKLIKPSFLNFKVIVIFCNPESVFLVIEQDFSSELSWKENSDFELSSELFWDLVSKLSLFYFIFVFNFWASFGKTVSKYN